VGGRIDNEFEIGYSTRIEHSLQGGGGQFRMGKRTRIWITVVVGICLVVGGAWIVGRGGVPGQAGPNVPAGTATQTLAPTSLATATPTATSTPEPLRFDPDQAYQRVLEQCGFGPRPVGSINNRLLGDYLIQTVEEFGWATEVQEFTYQGVAGRNIIARKGKGPVVILGAHYDTRPHADRDPPETQDQFILGADDGGSGVAVLLELARVLDIDRVPYEVRLVFFDAEDRGNLDGWPFSVGAEEYAAALDVSPEYVIVVDMVGDKEQAFYWDGNSDAELNARIWSLAAELGYSAVFVPQVRWQMIDDHLPFARHGWKAVDIIDFDYPYWHTTQDTADKVSGESLYRVGHVLEVMLEQGANTGG
jgi:glutaminyl-peptide cyclotransferase